MKFVKSSKYNKNQRLKTYLIVFIFVLMELFNFTYYNKPACLIMTIPELLIVIALAFLDRMEKAVLLHLVFIILAFDRTSALSSDLFLYSYSKLKLVGPLTISYIVGGFLWIKVYIEHPFIRNKNTLFFKLRQTLRFLLLSGTIIGLIGILFLSYPFNYFVGPLIYMLNGFMYVDILIRLYNPLYIKKIYYMAFCLMIASPIASIVGFYYLNLKSQYSIFDALLTNEIFIFAPCLLIALVFKTKFKELILAGLISYLLCLITAGRGGYFLEFFMAVLLTFYVLYLSNGHYNKKSKYATIIKLVMPFLLVAVVFILPNITLGGLAATKMEQVASLGNIFDNSSQLDEVSGSPYVRIAEAVELLYEGIQNPFYLFLGHGYGGYYTDSLGLFSGIDLSSGVFQFDAVKSGKFRTAHSVIPNMLLFNGLIGLYMVFKMGLVYVKHISETPLVFAAAVIFFISFYYNVSIIVAAVFVLYAAELRFNYRNS